MAESPLFHTTQRLTGDGIRHAFFTRKGGVSEGVFAGLNCGPGSSDDSAAVAENRARAASALGAAPDHLLTLFQIHSPKVAAIDAPFSPDARPQADAMVTRVPGLALGILAADCAPLLFADPAARVIGAAHAGWKGARGGVAEATIAAMETLGAARSRITVVIGPCIAQAVYEVGPEFIAAFTGDEPDAARFFAPAARAGHAQFDLPGYLVARLRKAGIADAGALNRCTYAAPDMYFSYRRTTHRGEPDYGRNLSAIMLAP